MTLKLYEETEREVVWEWIQKQYVDCNKPLLKKLMYKSFQNAEKQCSKWNDYEMYVAPFEKDKPICYEFTACPVAEFARQHNLFEVMHLCKRQQVRFYHLRRQRPVSERPPRIS